MATFTFTGTTTTTQDDRHPTLYVGYDTDHHDDDQDTDSQVAGWAWDMSATNVLTYSFIKYDEEVTYSDSASNRKEFSETWKAQTRLALAEVSKVIGIEFEEADQPTSVQDAIDNGSQGVLRFATADGMGTAFGYYPNSGESGGDSMFNLSNFDADANLGTYTFHTIMHEIGHTMGLKHGHEENGPGALTDDKDSFEYSIMTYSAHSGDAPSFYAAKSGHGAQSLMMYDIAALQRLYGADHTVEAGATVYTFDATNGQMFINGVGQGIAQNDNNQNSNVLFRTVWDGDGSDTYDLSNFATNMAIDLAPGSYSDLDVDGNTLRAMLNQGWNGSGSYVGANAQVYARGHIFNAELHDDDVRSLIENALGGSGDDIILGNQADNTLDGGVGDDMLSGGIGHDTLLGDDGSDVIDGGVGDDEVWGGRARDFIDGGGGADTIDGNRGRDVMTGGAGDDTLTGGGGPDRFKFQENDGHDTITDYNADRDMLIFDICKDAGDVIATTVGNDLVIDYGYGDTVTLEGLGLIELPNLDIVLA